MFRGEVVALQGRRTPFGGINGSQKSIRALHLIMGASLTDRRGAEPRSLPLSLPTSSGDSGAAVAYTQYIHTCARALAPHSRLSGTVIVFARVDGHLHPI